MGVEPPRSPDDAGGAGRQRATWAAWCAGGGAALGVTAGVCGALGVISPQQAIATGTPAAVLFVGGLVVLILSEPAAGWRRGARAGLRIGLLLGRRRPGPDDRRHGIEPNGNAQPNNHALAWPDERRPAS